MSKEPSRSSQLVRCYQRFLEDQNSSAFIKAVALKYTPATLERLATFEERLARRAAVLSLGYLGEYDSNPVLGKALVDKDRGVRTLAESAIRNLWGRIGSPEQRLRLRMIMRYNHSKKYREAVIEATKLIHESPWIAEAWCQRGTAYFHQKNLDAAIRDCHQALEINPYHFTAATGMGQCYMLQNNPNAALESFQRALRLNPNMEEVRSHVIQLQQAMKKNKNKDA